MYSLNLKNILILSCLQTLSASVNAGFILPIGPLYYAPETSGNYLFPDVGGDMPHCSENNAFAKSYKISGRGISGRDDLWYYAKVKESAFVTLNNKNGKGGAIRIKISPLGLRKTSTVNWVRDSHYVTGDMCNSQVLNNDMYGEKSINSNGSVSLGVHKGYGSTMYKTLAFELLDAQSVQAGTYSATGGYQFTSSQISMVYHTNGSLRSSPLIPNLTVVIPHTFNIDMPSPSVSLSPIYQNDETSTGEVQFNAQSNERYSITMTCRSPSAGTDNSDCYFADTLMELSAKVRFPVQSQTYDLKNGKAVYVDGPQFTDISQEYPGYIDFTLNGIDKYGEAGKTYVDTVNITFEADF